MNNFAHHQRTPISWTTLLSLNEHRFHEQLCSSKSIQVHRFHEQPCSPSKNTDFRNNSAVKKTPMYFMNFALGEHVSWTYFYYVSYHRFHERVCSSSCKNPIDFMNGFALWKHTITSWSGFLTRQRPQISWTTLLSVKEHRNTLYVKPSFIVLIYTYVIYICLACTTVYICDTSSGKIYKLNMPW